METDTPINDTSFTKDVYDGTAFFHSFFNTSNFNPIQCCEFKQIDTKHHIESTNTTQKAWAQFTYDVGITVIVVFWEIITGKYWNIAIIEGSHLLYSKEQFRNNTNYDTFYYEYSTLYPNSTWLVEKYIHDAPPTGQSSSGMISYIVCMGGLPYVDNTLTSIIYQQGHRTYLDIYKVMQFLPTLGNILYTYAHFLVYNIARLLNMDFNTLVNTDITSDEWRNSPIVIYALPVMPVLIGGFIEQVESKPTLENILYFYTQHTELFNKLLDGLYQISTDYIRRNQGMSGISNNNTDEPLMTYFIETRKFLGYTNP